VTRKGYEIGSGSVFKDLGAPNAEEHFVKAQLVFKIDALIKVRGLKQVEAPTCLASASPMYPKCCGASYDSFPSSGCCAF
jgi:predicted XRE-type DNA-binding protein